MFDKKTSALNKGRQNICAIPHIYVLSKYHQKVILIKNSGDIDIICYYKNSKTILHDILEYKVFLNITIGKNHIHLIL